MNTLIRTVKAEMGIAGRERIRLPCAAGIAIGYLFDLAASLTRRSFSVSSVRVRKFCATTQFESAVAETGYEAPVPLIEALKRTVRYEFLEDHPDRVTFLTE